jgi:exodeoxyribonuclease VII large subunit
MNTHISLGQLLEQVKSTLKQSLPFSWWIAAEISEMKVNYSGHCYLELIEKDYDNDTVKAKARATIWASAFRMIQPYFTTTAGTPLRAGIKVMVKVTVEFHELYGFSLNITDIEPTFTLGDLARARAEIIHRLKSEGIFEMNKGTFFPPLPGRLAVISSKTAAGYGDFVDQLTRNPFGYHFQIKLFPAVMQGNDAESSIVKALDQIFPREKQFDAVVLIRGGGAQADLHCFNSYWLASHICQFPLPVLTGIGHEQDETIADLVAHTRLKTPTAVAEFLIDQYRAANDRINYLTTAFCDAVSERLRHEWQTLTYCLTTLKPLVNRQLTARKNQIHLKCHLLKAQVKQYTLRANKNLQQQKILARHLIRQQITRTRHALELFDKKNAYLDPFQILSRGYSVTYYQGKAVKNASGVAQNDILETRLAEGHIQSIITTTKT